MAAGLSQVQYVHSGFEQASRLQVVRALEKIEPSGGSALLDAILESTRRIKKLCGFLQKTGGMDQWHLYHVILTDGEDTMSRSQSEWVQSASLDCIQSSGAVHWENHVFCITFGDIRSNRQLIPLQQLSKLLTFHYHSSAEIAASMQAFAAVLNPPCALVLTIDISQSMRDCWTETKEGVAALVRNLHGSCLMAVTCFHEDVMSLNEAEIQPMEHKRPISELETLHSANRSKSALCECPTSCSTPSCLLS